MISKVFQKDPTICSETRMNVLFDSAGDKDAKGEGGILIEEFERGGDEFLHAFFIIALVETVDDDEIRIG